MLSHRSGFTLDEAEQNELAVALTFGDSSVQCAVFGGAVLRDLPGFFLAKNAGALPACPFASPAVPPAAPVVALEGLVFGDLDPTPSTTDPHRLGFRINWVDAPSSVPIWGHIIQRWNPFTGEWINYATPDIVNDPDSWEDSDLRGELFFRVLTVYELPWGEHFFSDWSTTEQITVAPRPNLKVVLGLDWDLDGTLEGEDIETALSYCHPGCNLLLAAGTYENVNLVIGDFPDGFALYGVGMGKTILRSALFPVDQVETILRLGPHDFSWPVFQDFTIQGRRDDQPFPGFGAGFSYGDNRHGFSTETSSPTGTAGHS